MAKQLSFLPLVVTLLGFFATFSHGATVGGTQVPILLNDDGETPEPIIINEARGNDGTHIVVSDGQVPDDLPEFLLEENEGFEMLNPTHVNGEELFESDILLTPQQREAMAQRKAIMSYAEYRWEIGSDGFPHVPYTYGDNEVVQSAVEAAIAHWEEHTCIKFDDATNLTAPHLRFINGTGCWSYIGRIWFWAGQDISIGIGCTALGTAAHEIGHAMGFFHEQSRSDRDSYVVINPDNILTGREHNFVKAADADVSNFSVPYDYSSDMHYGGRYFSKNSHLTIATINPLAQELIGSRAGLSHRDKLLANRMYPCIEKWLADCGKTSDPCQNDGYTGADCACVCPSGTSGTNCENVDGDYYDDKLSGYSEKITTETDVMSPSYPGYYNGGLRVVKWIVAPECHVVELTFSFFYLYKQTTCRDGSPSCCYWESLEIRTSNLFDGELFCDRMISEGDTFTSESNEMILYLKTATQYPGFNASIKFVVDPSCTPSPTTTTTPPTTTTTPPTTTTTPPTTTTTPPTTTTTPPTTTTTPPTTTTTPPTTTTTPTTTLTTTTTTPTTTLTTTTTTPTTTTPLGPAACNIASYNDVYYWTSPYFGQHNYPDDFQCGATASTEYPRWTLIKLQPLILQDSDENGCPDEVSITTTYDTEREFCGVKYWKKLKLPTFTFSLNFESDSSITNTGFNISIQSRTSVCHKIITLTSLGETGVFKTPRYPKRDWKKGRMCEVWFIAPSPYHVQLDFLGFKLRNPCSKNNLIINPDGDHAYPEATSSRHCRKTKPTTMFSSGNEIDLVYVTSKRNKGFAVRYTVVEFVK